MNFVEIVRDVGLLVVAGYVTWHRLQTLTLRDEMEKLKKQLAPSPPVSSLDRPQVERAFEARKERALKVLEKYEAGDPIAPTKAAEPTFNLQAFAHAYPAFYKEMYARLRFHNEFLPKQINDLLDRGFHPRRIRDELYAVVTADLEKYFELSRMPVVEQIRKGVLMPSCSENGISVPPDDR